MRLLKLVNAGMAALTIVGCASKAGANMGASPESGVPTWSGSLQPTQQRTGSLAVTGQSKAFGTVVIRPAAGALRRMHVQLTVSVPTSGATQYRWALLPDRCGTGELPLIGFEQFPIIDIGSNGRGQIEADLPLELSANSTYHVNVYSSGQQLDNVVTCANMKYEVSR
jgi:hypothetical protein